MRWVLAVLLAGASVTTGIAARAPAAERTGDAFAWFAARGFNPAAPSRALGGSEGHRLHLVASSDAPGCMIALVPLDSPEELLPVLRREMPDEVWAGARLWLDGLRQGVPSPAALQAERLLLRLRNGAAPRPAVVMMEPGCTALIAGHAPPV